MADKINIARGPASMIMEGTADAMDNIWDAYVQWPWENAGAESDIDQMEFSYRCQGFTPPPDGSPTYEVYWHGVAVQMIASGVKMQRKLDLNFRLDATWNLYHKFVTWKKLTSDSNTSGVANKAAALGKMFFAVPNTEYVSTSFTKPGASGTDPGTLMIGSDKGGGELQKGSNCVWYGINCVQVVDVGKPTFKQSASGTAPTFKVSLIFGDYADSFYDQIDAGGSAGGGE